ncbi:MAG: hypothetical protein DCC43_10255 [Candidatus Brocadia sp.]|jgi:Protein of unknown function (DUF721).|uniref:DUF721 domain-containing protein n=1 Tax=Candidatus Brocadia fulgida TaxID=380242 RepID=A0A0M2USG9_9BACT|nr:MAG: hypothetical protein BROFUL_02505 [Candidatus Brocadia fulgida]MCC6324119.1 DUF721 domain-containing protein [Candidatus Brocadia sp.]MCE7911721.1 DUF721 domain-containing protein [Candidatus Brocadia sp. AMX3]OQZ01710.1 MAG: hypothetical protein B6D35_02365 [Candidatus Brocadia sp. UTAMX2]MBV6519064.1 hypothetical protein [Candidatus Brocadia fulgida]
MLGELPERYFFNKRSAVKVGQVLKGLFPKKSSGDKIFQEVRAAWKDVVGEEVSRCTEIVDLKRGVLYVTVESTVLIHHLTSFEKDAIIAKIHELTCIKYVHDIRFKVGMLNNDRRK